MKNHQWSPCKWRIDGAKDGLGEVFIARVTNSDGTDRYAVRQGDNVLNTDGGWEYEPQPSNRDDAFFKRCRFATFDDAAMCYQFHNPAK